LVIAQNDLRPVKKKILYSHRTRKPLSDRTNKQKIKETSKETPPKKTNLYGRDALTEIIESKLWKVQIDNVCKKFPLQSREVVAKAVVKTHGHGGQATQILRAAAAQRERTNNRK
jgi:hypothetical protein